MKSGRQSGLVFGAVFKTVRRLLKSLVCSIRTVFRHPSAPLAPSSAVFGRSPARPHRFILAEGSKPFAFYLRKPARHCLNSRRQPAAGSANVVLSSTEFVRQLYEVVPAHVSGGSGRPVGGEWGGQQSRRGQSRGQRQHPPVAPRPALVRSAR